MSVCRSAHLSWIVCAILGLTIGASDCSAGRAQAAGYGTITGQFVLEGEVPKLAPLVKEGDANVKNPEVCAKQNVPGKWKLLEVIEWYRFLNILF